MTLIIEDGTNVPNATSYATVAEFITYAEVRGIAVPTADADVEPLLIKGMDYIEVKDAQFYGVREYDDQYLSFPRWYNNETSGIPKSLKDAQIVLAIAAQTIDFFPVSSGTVRGTTREIVGPITVEYDESAPSNYPRVPQADALLRPLYGYGYGQLRVVRA